MPRRNLDRHFEEERPEWTVRKHSLLERYVVPATMKMSRADPFRRVHLVDGHAGPNEYGGRVMGSTLIMIEAAMKAQRKGRKVLVHACEPDRARFGSLKNNLAVHIESGLLRAYNSTHADAVSDILAAKADAPAIAFLDPQTIGQMRLEEDIGTWAKQSRTDILGVFMASQPCRISTSAQTSQTDSAVAEAALGPKMA